jgi:chemotaxis protein MotB
MSASRRGGRSRHVEHEEEEHENEERWLVSFADMMTLMFALFMVLFSISSVNTAKFESLKTSLEQSFNAKLLSGGDHPLNPGNTSDSKEPTAQPPLASLTPTQAVSQSFEKSKADARAEAAKQEEEDFKKLKQRIDAKAGELGLQANVHTEIRDRGLVVQLLTDGVIFDSGSAELKPTAEPLLRPLGKLIRAERVHPIIVEGYTDSQPIQTGQFPTNWELSGARAARVVRHFIGDGVPMGRLSAAQFAQQHPIATNATPQGRSRNRRVEVVLARQNPVSTQGGKTP